MKRIWCVFAVLAIGKGCLMAAMAGKPVAHSSVSAPRLWAAGDEARYFVVTSKTWKQHYSSPPRDSDFDSCIYVVAAIGERPNPGYRVRIAQITQDGERVEVQVEQLGSEPGGIYPQVMVNPIAVEQIKKTDLQPYSSLSFSFVDQRGRTYASVKVEF